MDSPPSDSANRIVSAQSVARPVGQLQAAPRLDGDRGPGRMQPVRQPLGVAHQARGARILAEAHQNALARGSGTGNGIGLHVGEQLLVDPLGGAAQRQLAQRGQIARREIMLQIVGREIDQLDRVGAVEHLVRYGFAHPYMRDLRDHVIEAFDVLDVDRRVDVDATGQQLLDIEIAFGMTAARRAGMSEFVDRAICGRRAISASRSISSSVWSL